MSIAVPLESFCGSGGVVEEAFMEQAGKITSCRRSGSVMTFRCREEKPEIDIPVIVEVYV